jgi:hypothetical protein
MADAELKSVTVEQLAYRLWQQRGSPEGSPEVDWLQAEIDLQVDWDSQRRTAAARDATKPARRSGRGRNGADPH